jgi:hypothetical protein
MPYLGLWRRAQRFKRRSFKTINRPRRNRGKRGNMDWTEADFIAETPLAVRIYDGTANRMVVGVDAPKLIEPNRVFKGSFTRISLFLMIGTFRSSSFEIPFVRTNPREQEVADAIREWGSRQRPLRWGVNRPYGEVESVDASKDTTIAIECRPLADIATTGE